MFSNTFDELHKISIKDCTRRAITAGLSVFLDRTPTVLLLGHGSSSWMVWFTKR